MKKRYMIPLVIVGIFVGLIALGMALDDRTPEEREADMEAFEREMEALERERELQETQTQAGFRDLTGYTPSWAVGKGDNQILAICSNRGYNDPGSRDFNWCSEFSGYVIDKINPTHRPNVLRDSTGYSPSWAAGKGDSQILGICSSRGYDNPGSRDFNWCSEFAGYVLDKLNR